MVTFRRLALPSLAVLIALALLAAPALAGPADKARLAAKQKRWQDAAAAWTEVLDKSPANKEAAIGLANAARQGTLLDFYLPAEEALQRVLEKKQSDREARLALGDLFIAQARSKRDQTAMKFLYEDAKSQFGQLLKKNPGDEDAAVGLARAHYWTAFFSEALQVLDEFLAQGASKGDALYWKGQIYYMQARDAYAQSGALDEQAKGLFRKAMGSYEQATKANPELLDAWMQYGYSAQYLGETDAAEQAYEKAMTLDPESMAPLKGIEALYYHRPAEYTARLEELTKSHSANTAVYFFLGFNHLSKEKWEESVKAFKTYAKRSRSPDIIWSYLGRAYDKLGKTDEATDAYRKGLKANPDDMFAAGALEQRIVAKHGNARGWSVSDAQAAIADYKKLFDLAPNNPWIRNNAAFQLREAVGPALKGNHWKPILEECIKRYVEASEISERLIQGREDSMPYPDRHKYAQVINDTGLMFHYYPSKKDAQKAEDYYIRALELTADGYRDAWENLAKLYMEQGRWQDAYDLSRDCAQTLMNENGTPHPHRQQAQAWADKMVAEGRVTGD